MEEVALGLSLDEKRRRRSGNGVPGRRQSIKEDMECIRVWWVLEIILCGWDTEGDVP